LLYQNKITRNTNKDYFQKWLETQGIKMGDSPESEIAAGSWMECSIYQNYTASEVLVQGIAGVINQKDVELIVRAQKKMLQRFEKTNEMLTNVNSLSATRLERAQADFKKHSQTVDTMKKDLEYIFKKIRQIKGKLSSQYPEAYSAATEEKHKIEGEEDDEYDVMIRKSKLQAQQQTKEQGHQIQGSKDQGRQMQGNHEQQSEP